jgi:hypothetical protein
MKKLLLTLGLLLFGSSMGLAQYTTVTATSVTDSDSTVWANAPFTWSFQPGPYQSNATNYTYNSAPLSQLGGSGTTDGSGNFSISSLIYDVTLIRPIGASYKLTLCPNASAACATINFSPSGGSVSLTSQLDAAILAPRFVATPTAYGYNDGEAQIQVHPGSTYWNTTSSVQRCYTGSVWGACSSGGIGGTVAAGYVPIATALDTLGNGPIDVGVTMPDRLTINNTGTGGTTIQDTGGGTVNFSSAADIVNDFATNYQINAPNGNVFSYTGSDGGLHISTSNDATGVLDGELAVVAGTFLALATDPTPSTTLGGIDIEQDSTNADSSLVIDNQGGAGLRLIDSGVGGISFDALGSNPTPIPGAILVNGPIVPHTIYSAAGTPLPSCTSTLKGAEATVSDATLPTYLAAYTSGGGVVAPVMCNGTNWVTY